MNITAARARLADLAMRAENAPSMADDLLTTGTKVVATTVVSDSASWKSESNLPTFRFSLRQLFVSTAFASVLLATITATTVLTAAFILLLTTVIAAHVFATVLGNRLLARTNADHSATAEQSAALPPSLPPTQRAPVT